MTSVDEIGTTREKHPVGLYVLFATEMWERFGFYTAAAVMTLYLQRGGFGWTKDQATSLWSNYLMFVYATPLLGGWLADKFLGYRRSVLIGGAFFIAGYGLLGLGSITTYYIALGLIFAGNGFFKPNISTMVGNLYASGSPLRDAAYNIFYMGINVGALLAPLVAEGSLQLLAGRAILDAASRGEPLTPEQAAALRAGYLGAFFAAMAGMTLGTVLFAALYRKLGAVERRHKPVDHSAQEVAVTEDLPTLYDDEVERTAAPADAAKPGSAGVGVAIDKVPEATRIGALLIIYAIVIVFWMVFHQNGSTMTYWADENTNWSVSGTFSNAINPFWIVVLSIPLVRFWDWLNSRGMEPSTPTKMAIGMLMTSLAFLILFIAAKTGGDQTFLTDSQGHLLLDSKGQFLVEQHRVSPFWLIAAYAVISLGELMLSPMGLSLVSKVAPVRMRGLMMGGWFVATAIGNKLTAIGLLWTRWYHSSFWLLCSLSAFVMALVLLGLLRTLKRAMPGV
jgi:POT family proton-dependent oligopeptide transporter